MPWRLASYRRPKTARARPAARQRRQLRRHRGRGMSPRRSAESLAARFPRTGWGSPVRGAARSHRNCGEGHRPRAAIRR